MENTNRNSSFGAVVAICGAAFVLAFSAASHVLGADPMDRVAYVGFACDVDPIRVSAVASDSALNSCVRIERHVIDGGR